MTNSTSNSGKPAFPPIQLGIRTPFEPTAIPSGGRNYLVYELHLQNFSGDALPLRGLEVMDASSEEKPIAQINGQSFYEQLRPIGADKIDGDHPLGAGQSAVAFICLAFDSSSVVPGKLSHRVLTGNSIAMGPTIDTRHTTLRVLGRPLVGTDWIAADGPSLYSHHRTGLFVMGGLAQISRRYAIDWKKVRQGASFSGDARDVRSYHAYGEKVLAVADATVIVAKDGLPDNIPKTAAGFNTAVPMTMETVAGNSIVLDLGDGQFAYYAHLKPGSLRVKTGDRVRRGDLLAQIGNSGDAREPHLHFQVTTFPDILASEGVPYLIDHYRIKVAGGDWQTRTREFPLGDMVIDFGEDAAAAPLLAVVAPAQGDTVIALRDVSIIDVTDGSLASHQTVLIGGNRIRAVGLTGEIALPSGAVEVDARGKYLIPGLWDMHVHTADPSYFPLFISNGVTGIRDMGGAVDKATDGCESVRPDWLLAWRSRIEAGSLIGPRIVLSGPPASGTGDSRSLPVRTVDEARSAVHMLRTLRADFVKVYEGIPLDAYLALADSSREAGLPFAGHVPAGTVGLLDAIRAGQRSIEHIRDALLLCFTDDPEELAGFLAADHWSKDDVAWADTIHGQCPQVIEALKRYDVWLTPTLVVEHAKVAVEDDAFTQDTRRAMLPKSIREAFDAYVLSKRAQSPSERESEHLWWKKQQRLVRRMNEAGAKFLAGTDAACEGGLPGFSLHNELALLVEAGFSPLKAIQAATLDPARYFGTVDSMGKVVPGALADLLLLNANPLDDISNTRDIYATVFNGRLFPRAELDTMVQMSNNHRERE